MKTCKSPQRRHDLRLRTQRWVIGYAILLLSILVFVQGGKAEDVSVQAALSQGSAEVGEAVDMQIVVSGARNGSVPREIQVDGLAINYNGQSTNMQMNGFNFSVSLIHNYTVIPQRAGTFTIPPQTIDVGGKTFTTQPLTLSVSSSGGSAQGGGGADGKLAFAELVIPKTKAYVGEVIPVELRIYVDSRIRWDMQQLPAITAEGFTTQKFTDPAKNQIQKDNRVYDLITFKTAITPIKTGQLSVGPIDIHCIAQLPQRRKRPRFGPDIDSLLGDAFGMDAPVQRMDIRSSRSDLDVRSLPPNAPKSFAGAVGTFTLTSKANPTKVNVGDPITYSMAIAGRGNFDRVNAPKLMEENGWRSYPASSKFKADDDVGISGVKSFEMAVIPEQVQTKLPLVEFSYFDPIKEAYVTLHADRDPVSIAGVAPTPSSSAVASSLSTPAPTPTAATPTPTPAPADIRYILTGPTEWGRSFQPIFQRKPFWQMQILPLLGLLAFVGFQISKARKADVKGQRLAELRAQKNRLMEQIRGDSLDSKSFYEAAMQVIQLEAASLDGARIPSSIGVGEACNFRGSDPDTSERVRKIFNRCDQFRYAGSTSTSGKPSPEERTEVLQTLSAFQNIKESDKQEKSHAIS